MFLRPFGWYRSACFGILFVSILCTWCSHFSRYCITRISFTFLSVLPFFFSLKHWFFSLSSFLIPCKCLMNFISAASKRCSSLFFSTQASLPQFEGRYVRKSWRISLLNWDKFVCAVMASLKAMIDCSVERKLMLLVKWIRGSYIRSNSALNVIVASLVWWLVETSRRIGGLLPPSHTLLMEWEWQPVVTFAMFWHVLWIAGLRRGALRSFRNVNATLIGSSLPTFRDNLSR